MERKHWKRSYGYFPQFLCPRCRKGNLKSTKDKYKREPKHVTIELRDHEMQGEDSEGRFVAMLACSNRICGEIVAVAGDYESHATVDYGPTGQLEMSWDDTFRPNSMHPAPHIITWPKSLTGPPTMHLLVSFELFWVDMAACANRLRIVVEVLLDQLGIPRAKAPGEKGPKHLDLAARIARLGDARPGHEHALNALRYVGNAGSHHGVVDIGDVLDCYELLEDAMVELLEHRRERLNAIAKRINDENTKPKP
ncbi:DUF4145 domain-containing protein (plasmid) [Rhizobium sp. CB3060]|uniref:DUF4145 domain-containing protein n=1 Tax=Rhizobium sp. CB3060 TaxID=3138255 RepID=UPI0021A923C2|nr:DUF4145 domain-containing protein [Rhizobium tropici]UWU25949.1 DUF4145 domain-containing protein [Rhizobium tropici]